MKRRDFFALAAALAGTRAISAPAPLSKRDRMMRWLADEMEMKSIVGNVDRRISDGMRDADRTVLSVAKVSSSSMLRFGAQPVPRRV